MESVSITLTRPEDECVIVLQDQDGKTVLSKNIVYLDALWAEVLLENENEPLHQQYKAFATKINVESNGTIISESDVHFILEQVYSRIQKLKKNISTTTNSTSSGLAPSGEVQES